MSSEPATVQNPKPSILIYARDAHGEFKVVSLDGLGGLIVTEIEHALIHQSRMFCFRHEFTAIGLGTDTLFLLKTGAKIPHLRVTMSNNSAAFIRFYRTPDVSADGTPQTINNHDDNSEEVSAASIFKDPTLVGGDKGTLLPGMTEYVPAGNKQGSDSRSEGEEKLRSNTEYIIEWSQTQNNGEGILKFSWYEENV